MSGFQPTSDQRDVVEAMERSIAEVLPLSRFQANPVDGRFCLKQLAELGCLGISLSEAVGGAELSATEEALVFQHLGRYLSPPSAVAASLAARIAADAKADDQAAAILAADSLVALAKHKPAGDGVILYGAQACDLLLVLAKEGPQLYAATALGNRRLVDQEQWGLPLEEASLQGAPLFKGNARLADRAALLCAAQLSGIALAARDMAVEYARVREQFGKPIGSFQAVKHHCADMASWAMNASDLLSFAAVAVADERPDAAFQCRAALLIALRAAKANAGLNIQIHGGIGFSHELSAHFLLKRAHVWTEIANGDSAVRQQLLSEPFPLRRGAILGERRTIGSND